MAEKRINLIKLLAKIKKHNFTKELRRFEYETKFNVETDKYGDLAFLKKIEACFEDKQRYVLCKIARGDRLVTHVNFFLHQAKEYTLFKYRGARMLKVKKHKILRKSSPIPIFKNEETLLIDKDDFQKKLKSWQYRFRRHRFYLINLRKRLKKLGFANEKSIGSMTKIRVKDFVFDRKEGRIYAVAVTFCRSGKRLQKQLEIEYSGYVPGVGKRENNSENEVISGVIALSSFIHSRFRKFLTPTVERKFDFVTL